MARDYTKIMARWDDWEIGRKVWCLKSSGGIAGEI